MKKNNNTNCNIFEDYSNEDKRMMSLRMQGKTFKEIAEKIGKEEPAVRMRFSRKLTKAIEDYGIQLRIINWEHCQKDIISKAFDLYEQAEEHSDKRQTLNTLSKLLEPFTPKDKQPEGTNIHIKILTAKEAELAEEQGDTVIKVDEYFSEKDEEQ